VILRSTYLGDGEDVCYGSEDAFRKIDRNEVFSSVDCCYSGAKQVYGIVLVLVTRSLGFKRGRSTKYFVSRKDRS